MKSMMRPSKERMTEVRRIYAQWVNDPCASNGQKADSRTILKLLAEIDALRAEIDNLNSRQLYEASMTALFDENVKLKAENEILKSENGKLQLAMNKFEGENEALKTQIKALIISRNSWIDAFNSNENDKVENSKLKQRIGKFREALQWIMPKIHQGNHERFFDTCTKAACIEYHKALAHDDEAAK